MSIMAENNVYDSIIDDKGLNEKLCFSAYASSGILTFIPKIERNIDKNMLDESEETMNEKNLILNDGVIRNTYNSTGQPPVYYEESLNACEEVEIDHKPFSSSIMYCETKMECGPDEWEENNQYEHSEMEVSFEENQPMPISHHSEIENVDDSDEETIATFLTAAGQRLALYAVEDSDEVFAVAVYDESGEPPTNFQFLMKSDVERLIGEGAVRTVKKPTQIKKQVLPNEPPIFQQNIDDNFEETQLNDEITKFYENEEREAHNTLKNNENFESNENVRDTTKKSSPLPDVKTQPDFTYVMMENNSVISSPLHDFERSEEIVETKVKVETDDELIEQSTVQYLLMDNEISNDELTFADIQEIMGIPEKNENQSLLKKVTKSRSLIDSTPLKSSIDLSSSIDPSPLIDSSPSIEVSPSIDLAPSEDPQTLADPATINNFDNLEDSDPNERFHSLNDTESIENFHPPNDPEPNENFHPLNDPKPNENFHPLNDPVPNENFHPLNDPEPNENFHSLNDPQPNENFPSPNDPEPNENFQPLNDPEPMEEFDPLSDPETNENFQPINDPESNDNYRSPYEEILLPSVQLKKIPTLQPRRKITTENIVITINALKKPQKPANPVRRTHLLSSLICRRTKNNNNRSNLPGTSLLIGNNEIKNSTTNIIPDIVQTSAKAKRPRKQQLTSVNRDDSEIIIQPATFTDMDDTIMTKRGKRKRRQVPMYKPKASSKKIKKSRRRKKRVKRRTVEIIEIDIDDDEENTEKNIVEITIDENKEKCSSDKENEVIMVGDSDDEDEKSPETTSSTSILKCEHCSRSFRQKRALETHSRICPKSPDTQRRLKERSSRRNSTRKSNDDKTPATKKEFVCKICQEKFDVVVALARHTRSMHSLRKKAHMPNQTTDGSVNDNENDKIGDNNDISTPMTRRRKRRKTNGGNCSWKGQQLYCTDCGKWFTSDALLRAHFLQHATKKSEKQIRRCQTCKKLLKSRLLYIRHMRMHSRVKKMQKKLHHTRQATGKLASLRTRGRPQKL